MLEHFPKWVILLIFRNFQFEDGGSSINFYADLGNGSRTKEMKKKRREKRGNSEDNRHCSIDRFNRVSQLPSSAVIAGSGNYMDCIQRILARIDSHGE